MENLCFYYYLHGDSDSLSCCLLYCCCFVSRARGSAFPEKEWPDRIMGCFRRPPSVEQRTAGQLLLRGCFRHVNVVEQIFGPAIAATPCTIARCRAALDLERLAASARKYEHAHVEI